MGLTLVPSLVSLPLTRCHHHHTHLFRNRLLSALDCAKDESKDEHEDDIGLIRLDHEDHPVPLDSRKRV